MLTEQRNPRSTHIDRLGTLDMLAVMNAEDATVAGVVQQALPAIAAVVDVVVEHLRGGGRLFYVGAGTSGRLGFLDAAECIPTFNTSPEMVQGIIAGGEQAMFQAIEGAEDDRAAAHTDLAAHRITHQDVVIGIAASGRTPYVLAAVAYAQEQGAATGGVACNDGSPLLDAVDLPVALPVGPEVVTGSTRLKAGTAQKLILNMISTATMIQLGKVYQNLMVDVQPTNDKLVGRAQRIVAEVVGVSQSEAAALLGRADNHVKTAIVMGLLDMDAAAAAEQLKQADGHLRRVIEADH